MRSVRCRSRLELLEGANFDQFNALKRDFSAMFGAKGMFGGISKVLLIAFNF